jgi:hypothetical protein
MNVGNYAKELTKNKCFISTSDMTAFTDLFPAILQRELLYKLVKDRDLANAWWTLLAERTFTVAWSGDHITYGTGQPMGAYASWPLCTLAHHLVMHYSAYKIGLANVNNHYRILGDDNVRDNESLSIFYEETLRNLGCELNPYKGTLSRSGVSHSSAEVAKRLYLNGIDISPLTPGIIKDLINPALINNALKDINQIFENPALPVHILNQVVPKNKRDKCWMLCTNPFNGVIKPGEPGYDDHADIWDEILEDNEYNEVMRRYRIKSLVDKANEFNVKNSLLNTWVRLQAEPQNVVESVEGDMELLSVPPYATSKCQKHILRELFRAIDKLKAPYAYLGDKALEEVEYLPDPNSPFTDRKDLRSTHTTLLVEKVFTFCEAREDVTTLRWNVPPTLKV